MKTEKDSPMYAMANPIHPNNRRYDTCVYLTCKCPINNVLQIKKSDIEEGRVTRVYCPKCGFYKDIRK